MAEKTQIALSKVKETKGTVVFSADSEDAAITTLYIRKGQGFDNTEKLTITLEVR